MILLEYDFEHYTFDDLQNLATHLASEAIEYGDESPEIYIRNSYEFKIKEADSNKYRDPSKAEKTKAEAMILDCIAETQKESDDYKQHLREYKN